MARSEALWKDPLMFIPERFSNDNEKLHPFQYIPFSAGPPIIFK